MMGWRHSSRLLCLVLSALVALPACHAHCNSLVMKHVFPNGCPGAPEYRGGVVSASSFSETWSLATGLWIMPEGSTTPMLDVSEDGTPSLYGRTATTKHSSVCLSHDAQGIAAQLGYDASNVPAGWNICNQGMNDKGLAVSFQAVSWQPVPAYDSTQGANAIHYFDMPKIVLTQFQTVAEVEAAYNYQIVSSPQYGFMGERQRTGSAQWLAIYDATGDAGVIEFVGGTGPRFRRNPLGVLANEPGFLDEQLSNYTRWLDNKGLTWDPETYLINGPVETLSTPGIPGTTTAVGGITVFRKPDCIPGGYDGDARFIRLGMLKSAAMLKGCGPDPQISPLSSMATRPGYPTLLPSMLAAKAIIESVALPLGMTDFGEMALTYSGTGTDWKQDQTFWFTMRDHKDMLFLYRTGNNMAYRMFDLKRMSDEGYNSNYEDSGSYDDDDNDGTEASLQKHGHRHKRHNKHDSDKRHNYPDTDTKHDYQDTDTKHNYEDTDTKHNYQDTDKHNYPDTDKHNYQDTDTKDNYQDTDKHNYHDSDNYHDSEKDHDSDNDNESDSDNGNDSNNDQGCKPRAKFVPLVGLRNPGIVDVTKKFI